MLKIEESNDSRPLGGQRSGKLENGLLEIRNAIAQKAQEYNGNIDRYQTVDLNGSREGIAQDSRNLRLGVKREREKR